MAVGTDRVSLLVYFNVGGKLSEEHNGFKAESYTVCLTGCK